MKVTLWITIRSQVDAFELWKEVKDYSMNVTEAVDKTWVYGDCSPGLAGLIVTICLKYGEVLADIRGCANEKKEEEA